MKGATKIFNTINAGIHLAVQRRGEVSRAEFPAGTFAVLVEVSSAWFAIDTAGNVRGDPEAVERQALLFDLNENLPARAAVGMARLALRNLHGRTA